MLANDAYLYRTIINNGTNVPYKAVPGMYGTVCSTYVVPYRTYSNNKILYGTVGKQVLLAVLVHAPVGLNWRFRGKESQVCDNNPK